MNQPASRFIFLNPKSEIETRNLVFFPLLSAIFWVVVATFFLEGKAVAAEKLRSSYEASGVSAVSDDNYVNARKRAVVSAMRQAVRKGIEDMAGEAVTEGGKDALEAIIAQGEDYVSSYRFLYANDNFTERVAEVKLEVSLYIGALRKQLRTLGILGLSGGERAVAILIREKSLSIPAKAGFWDSVPISETALARHLAAAGIQIIGRSAVREAIDEAAVVAATKGDIAVAAQIGLRIGVDIIIVGSAVSSDAGGATEPGQKNIQANISLTAVSSAKSSVIAAKSDFAVAQADGLKGELEAFEKASGKISAFLLKSIRQFWEQKPAAAAPGTSPAPGTPQPAPSVPHPSTDL